MNDEQVTQLKALIKKLEVNSHKLDYNTNLTEDLAHKVSAMGSDLLAFKQEMKPWLEAKIGLNLIWRWAIAIPIVIATLIGVKTLLGWLGFHK